MSPIVKEVYKNNEPGCYAVAVVKKSNSGVNINTLQGKKTCHPGARSTVGWILPVGYLLARKLIIRLNCSQYGNVTGFVSAAKAFSQSCIPGELMLWWFSPGLFSTYTQYVFICGKWFQLGAISYLFGLFGQVRAVNQSITTTFTSHHITSHHTVFGEAKELIVGSLFESDLSLVRDLHFLLK